MDTQQGIYASPDNNRANRSREKVLNTYFVSYTVGLDSYVKGVAIVRAEKEKDVEDILKNSGIYSTLSCLYHIKEITKIPEGNKEEVLLEDVKLNNKQLWES